MAELRNNDVYEWPVLLAILGLVTIASVVQAHSGFGFALLFVPLTTTLIGPKETVLLVTLLALAMNSFQSLRLRRFVERRITTVLVAGSFVGMPVGLLALLFADPAALKAGAAIAVLAATALLARGVEFPAGGARSHLAAGIVSGVLNTSTGVNGPPIAIYLHNQLSPSEFRGTMAAFFLLSAVGALALLATASAIDTRAVWMGFLALPLVFLASAAGNRLFARTNAEDFRRVVLAILALSGTTALVVALIDLLQ